LAAAVLAFFKLMPVEINNETIYGSKAAAIVIIYIPIFGSLFAILSWMFLNVGNKLYSLFSKKKKTEEG